MSDQRIQYTEKLGGADHPTLADTLNRAKLVGHNSDGTHRIDSLLAAYLYVFPNFGVILGGSEPPTENQIAELTAMGVARNNIFWSPTAGE